MIAIKSALAYIALLIGTEQVTVPAVWGAR